MLRLNTKQQRQQTSHRLAAEVNATPFHPIPEHLSATIFFSSHKRVKSGFGPPVSAAIFEFSADPIVISPSNLQYLQLLIK